MFRYTGEVGGGGREGGEGGGREGRLRHSGLTLGMGGIGGGLTLGMGDRGWAYPGDGGG